MFVGGLVVLGGIIKGVPQVNPVVFLSNANRLFYLPVSLTDSAQQVEPFALFVALFSLLNHVQLNSHHPELRLGLLLLLGLPDAPGSSCELHVTDADLRHVQPFALDAHDGHLLPDGRVLDVLDTLVRLI